ncbi:uncharacterized protein [Mytilus edulis]|uniref:uncharacterized protein n=1 Tax=Mytilus edulis TaxID=6550 RepID=UPI0039EF48B1
MTDVNNASDVPTILMKKEKPRPSRNRLAAVAGPIPKQSTISAEAALQQPNAISGPSLQPSNAIAGPSLQQPNAISVPALQPLNAIAGHILWQPDAVVDQLEDEAVELAHLNVVRSKRLKVKKRPIPLLDLIYENQLEYNKFITKKVPKLLKMLGVSSDSDSD